MPLRALYSRSKGSYICRVCLEGSKHHASGQGDMEDHIRLVHPRTVLAWVFRDETESPEPGDDDEDHEDEPLSDDDDSGDDDSDEDMCIGPLSYKNLMKLNMGSIKCDSVEDAIYKIKSLSQLPNQLKQHFITCFFPCKINESVCIAVEPYKTTFSYPTKGHMQSAIRHVIYNAIQLELEGIVHGNLNSTDLVDINYVPKYCSTPIEFQSYSNFRANIDIQQQQICDCVDLIVGDGTEDEDYKVFRTRLLGSKTIVDLHSILYSPYLTPERQQPVYYCSCRVLFHYTKIHRPSFNTIVEDFRKDWSNIATSSSQIQISWRDTLKSSNHPDLIQMLDTRFSWDGRKLEYDDSPFSNHEYLYNCKRHINDKKVKVHTLEDMHEIMEALFREYPTEIWEYMHINGFNAYFGHEEYAYGMLNLVNKLTNRSDNNFCFSPLLQALKLCCIMLAKFHNLHEKNSPGNTPLPFASELDIAASEIESCIKGLQSSHKKMHNCLLMRINAYELKDVDVVVFKSVRIIFFALCFLELLISGKLSIGMCIVAAFDNTEKGFSKFSKPGELQMSIPSSRKRVLANTNKWPSYDDVLKIAGINFVISDGGKSTFSKKIKEELQKLVGMMKEG